MMGEGFYRRLLVLWPRSFRRRYGNEAVEIFRQRMDEARRRGTFTRIRAWSVLLFDVLATAVSARLERSARPSRGYRAGAPLAVLQDVRLSLRGMRRRPGLAMVLILTLAFGIAGSTTVFALAEWMLLRPVPGVRDPARLVRVGVGPANDARIEGIPVSYPLSDPDFTDLRRGAHTLAGLAGFFTEEANVSTTTSLPRRVSAAVVTANYFDVLGVTPARGRTFVAADGRPDEVDPVVLLAPDLAAAMFPSADPVGRRILVNGRPFTVVGVTPDGFHGHDLPGETRMWLPPSATRVLAPYVPSRWPDLREQMLWQVVGRLAPGADVAGAALDLSTVARRIAEAHPGETMFGDRQVPTVSGGVGASPALEARLSRALGRLGIGALILLLLAVANAGGLLVARAAMRERDVVIRRALGASRGAIVQRTVIESLLVAGLAGAVALALTKLALVGIEGLRLLQFGAAVEGARLDARVALFAAVVSAAAGLLTAVAPSMLAARERDLSQTRAGAPRQGLRRGLVIVQVALSVGLSVGAALMGRTVTKLSAVDPGVNIDDVLSFRVAPGLQQDWAPDGEQFFLAQVHSALATLPGARAVAFSWPAPFALQFARATVRRPDEPWDNAVQVRSFRVSPDFFETVELGSRQGPLPSTSSSEGDASGEPGIVVSRRMARLLFPDEDPLGRAVELRGVRGERRVAAVVEDMRVGSPRDAPAPILFEPLGQRRATGDYTVLVRTTGDPKALVPAIRRTLREVAPALPMFDVQTLRERVRRTIAEERTLAGVGAALAALGVLMTGLAIFGILEWAVATREREIGVRMALGAQARRVVGHVAAQALAMIGVGAIVGLPLAWVLARALRSQLFDVTPWDPIAWCGSAVVLLAVAALAAVRPAHRATRADPAEALRAE